MFDGFKILGCKVHIYVYFILGATVDRKGFFWAQLMPPRTMLGAFCAQVTFQEISKSEESNCLMLPVLAFYETLRNRCAIAPRFLALGS